MPNRIIHEKACNSQTLDAISDSAERLFWRLMTKADDYGRFEADARILLGACFPLRIGRMKPERVEAMRDELAHAGAITLYLVDGRVYGSFVAWDKHQRRRESKPKYPDPMSGTPYLGSGSHGSAHLQQTAANRGEVPHTESEIRPQEGQIATSAANGGDLRQLAARARTLGSRESRDVNGSREAARLASGGEAPPPAPRAPALAGFQIPESVTRALNRAPRLGRIGGFDRLREDAAWWYAETRAHPELDVAACVLGAESWLVTYPLRAARKKDAVRFLHNWFKTEETG